MSTLYELTNDYMNLLELAEDPDIDYFKESQLSYIGRTGTDRENAELICFLASDAASYIAGENIQIDGCRKKL